MNIEFDPAKSITNQRKHKVPLTLAEVFEWDTAQIEEDTRFDYPEQRFEATGYIGRHLYVMIYCLAENDATRIISLRRAEKYEERRYAKAQT